MCALRVVIKGRIERGEFKEPCRQCTEMLEQTEAQYRVNPTSIEPMDFALFFQSYPHEFLRADLTQLRRNNPFTPFFFVLGTCCEGMLRTAGSLDSPFYCYVHGWSDEKTEQIRRFLTDQPSVFSLPLTAEQDEIAQWKTDNRRGEVGVATNILPSQKSLILTHFGPFGNDSAMNQLLADEQRQLGFNPEFCYRLPSGVCRLPIFADADDSPREKILESIQRLRRQFADNEFVVYVDSPRIDEKEDYIKAGVTRVLPKIR